MSCPCPRWNTIKKLPCPIAVQYPSLISVFVFLLLEMLVGQDYKANTTNSIL